MRAGHLGLPGGGGSLPAFCHLEAGELGRGEGLGPRGIGDWKGWPRGAQVRPLCRMLGSVGHRTTLATAELPPGADESGLGGLWRPQQGGQLLGTSAVEATSRRKAGLGASRPASPICTHLPPLWPLLSHPQNKVRRQSTAPLRRGLLGISRHTVSPDLVCSFTKPGKSSSCGCFQKNSKSLILSF